MATSANVRYNETTAQAEVIDTTDPEFAKNFRGFVYMKPQPDTQPERVPIFCQKTGKLMARVSLFGDWTAEMRQWLWCRGCHMEHEITRENIDKARTLYEDTEEERALDARAKVINH